MSSVKGFCYVASWKECVFVTKNIWWHFKNKNVLKSDKCSEVFIVLDSVFNEHNKFAYVFLLLYWPPVLNFNSIVGNFLSMDSLSAWVCLVDAEQNEGRAASVLKMYGTL